MKPISLRCPHCGAPIKNSLKNVIVDCPYCDSSINVDAIGIASSSEASLNNMLTAARKAINNNMYNRAYEIYNEILLSDTSNLEADFYSHILYLKSHIKDYAEFDRVKCNIKAKAFIEGLSACNIADQELFNTVISLFTLLDSIACDIDIFIRDEYSSIDMGGYADLFNCRDIIIDIADTLCDLYPNDEVIRSICVNEWTVQLNFIQDKDRIKAIKKKIGHYGTASNDSKTGIEDLNPDNQKLDAKGCFGCLGVVILLILMCSIIGSCAGSN